MNDRPFVLPLRECRDNAVAGGKAINLGILLRAGFPVPDGFAVTTHAFIHARQTGADMPDDVANAIRRAYADLGSPTVAVRSSATAEDMADASMAGQYETFLDLDGADAVIDAVQNCWASIDTDRVRSYLQEHGIPFEKVAMAVAVQKLAKSDTAGVLFTANPQTGNPDEMLIEAGWGLGEAVVSGIVQPDTLVIDRGSGGVKKATIQDKQVWIEPGSHEERPVPEDRRTVPCLNARQVLQLWQLGLQVAEHFGKPQDLEWGFEGDALYLLQSRAVTTLADAAAYEEVLTTTRHQLLQARAAGRGDWVRHNIGETLPHPTPLTWSLIRRFMSGNGGFGAMYRQVGFEPTDDVSRHGFLDLVGGRIYMDLARAPDMFFADFPFEYDLDALRSNPDAAQGPPTVPTGGMMANVKIAGKLGAVNQKLLELADDFDRKLRDEIIPAFENYVDAEKAKDLPAMSTQDLLDLFDEREKEVLDTFAPQSLLPSLIGAMALDTLETFCRENFWDDVPEELVNLLSAGGPADLTVQANQGLYDLAQGDLDIDAWLAKYGHRAPEEFDLASPRWREKPDAVKQMAGHLKDGDAPLRLHEKRAAAAQARADELAQDLAAAGRREFHEHLELARRYLHFREDGKYYLMLGYDLLRDVARELGRRLELDDDVFFLTREELRQTVASGYAPLHRITQRRAAYRAEVRLVLPDVITDVEIETLGEPPELEGGDRIPAFSISNGACTGPVRIVFAPDEAAALGDGYVLVCPSTDPSWTPLFVNAAGVVLERGGTLSHGAVVAREMGIPAVVVPNATQQFAAGEIISVDGHNGAVVRGAADAADAPEKPSPDDTRVAFNRMPPPPGDKERRTAVIRNVALGAWAAYFLFAFVFLDAKWLQQPTYAVFDALFLPLIAVFGKPVTVGLIGGAAAALLVLMQRFLTDHKRLVVAKRRAAALQQEAKDYDRGSPRYKALTALASPVQMRILWASLFPLALVLGPLIMSFLWFPKRVDSAVRNAKPGSAVIVTAVVDGDCAEPIRLEPDGALALDPTTPAAQKIFLARPPLERHLQRLRDNSSDVEGLPWDLAHAIAQAREAHINDLEAFLESDDMPPQEVTWALQPPADTAGKWPLTVAVNGRELTTWAVFGEGFAQEPRENITTVRSRRGKRRITTEYQVQVANAEDPENPIRQVQVRYREKLQKGEGTFWKPLDWFEPGEDTGPIKGMFAPWLILYILIYVPVMFIFRFALGIP